MTFPQSSAASFMAMPNFDDFFDDLSSSIRIAPLQGPLPATATSQGRPSPLEPSTRVNMDKEATKLTGRQLALAQAKPLEAPKQSELESIAQSKGPESEPPQLSPLEEHHKRKRKLHPHENIADFVHLPQPKPPAKVTDVNRRPFRPIAVLNELHEPPPSAALFPPITPSANQDEHEGAESGLPGVGSVKMAEASPGKELSNNADNAYKHVPMKRNYTRGRTKWTEDETDQLVKGVAIYGMGRWKDILDHPEFTFQKGRTYVDLKDRFRTLFPPNAPHKWVRKMPEKEDYSDGAVEPVRTISKDRRFPQRAPKRAWSEQEDASLEKGFRIYGYQWHMIAKDETLHFDNRNSSQIRDRFRLRFPELYEQEDPAPQPKPKPTRKRRTPATQEKKSETAEKADDQDPDSTRDNDQSKATSKGAAPFYLSGLLNGNDVDSGLSGSFPPYGWDDNVTLAPLQWEDMVPQPIFDLG